MTDPVFLVERSALAGSRVVLAGAEGRHAATVRRLRPGERVDLTDGAGHVAECVVARVGRDELELDVRARREEPPPAPRLAVVQALPKGDRGELAVEAMTEVGVDAIVPWEASRCVTRWRAERGARSLARWRARARESAKQSRRFWLPEVPELASTRAVAGMLAGAALGVVLHEDARTPLTSLTPPAYGDVVMVIGPEGGVTPEELETFASAGAVAARLGPTVLRTSTAGVAAASVLLARCGRW